jgi:thiamine pyrophosphate-dependent acetolactate synthase large subunit-like protein
MDSVKVLFYHSIEEKAKDKAPKQDVEEGLALLKEEKLILLNLGADVNLKKAHSQLKNYLKIAS